MPRRRSRGRDAQAGFSYLALMIVVAILALATSATLTLGSIAQRRETEQRLLEVGNAYRRAIRSYVDSSPAGDRRYPSALSDLVRDPRHAGVRRHLRQLYPDPITGKNDWVLIQAPGGGIMGIYSRSNGSPIKIAGFDAEDQVFEGKVRYSEWVFAVQPAAVGVAPRAGSPAGRNPAAAASPAAPGLFPQPSAAATPAASAAPAVPQR